MLVLLRGVGFEKGKLCFKEEEVVNRIEDGRCEGNEEEKGVPDSVW